MAISQTLNLPLRGNITDLVQHHNWLLMATTHSEGQNLGVQFSSIHNVLARVESERWIMTTPKAIQHFVSMPNQPTPAMTFSYDGTALDPEMLDRVLMNRGDIKKSLRKAQKASEGDTTLTNEQQLTIAKRALEISLAQELSELEVSTLVYVLQVIEDGKACREIEKALEQAVHEYTYNPAFQQGQRIVCIDEDGQGYHVPYIPAESDFDGDVGRLSLTPFSITDTIEFAAPLSHNLLVAVVSNDDEQSVVLYNLDSNTVLWSESAPQELSNAEEDTEQSGPRRITALGADVAEIPHFALGFDDGLYLIFRCKFGESVEVERLELYDFQRQVLTSQASSEQMGHTSRITGLHFSLSHDDVLYLRAFADDLTMSRLKVSERIPKGIAAAGRNGHSKNIRRFLSGPGYYFYSLSYDNTLRMWETEKSFSKSLSLSATCVSTARVPYKNRKGQWSFEDLLVSGHDNHTGAERLDSAEVSFRMIDMDDMTATGAVDDRVVRQFTGVWHYAQQEMKGKPEDREALLEYLADFGDPLSIEILIDFVRNESNPTFVSRALQLLNDTQHPRLVVIFTDLMSVPRERTCLDVLEYLRMPHLYGAESLYPLDLANDSSYLAVRQAALRGYAELAARRESDPSNITYQMAFERILSLFNDDDEDDIVNNAFQVLFAQETPFFPGIEGVLMTVAHSDPWIQKQGLKLLYMKGMIQDASTAEDALDVLRQVRESSNEDLRELAFKVSLFAEEGVQQYLRSLDEVLHNQLNDLESDRLNFAKDQFVIDSTVEQLFLDAVPEELRSEKEVDMTEAQDIVATLTPILETTKQRSEQDWYHQLNTISYCIQTFPMTSDVKSFLLSSRIELEYPAPKGDLELSDDDKMLLQEMALSYQPSIASLGAMALAKLGEPSALPILLMLVDDNDDLVKSRAVDGLLEFIHEPVVEQKLRLMVLQASNEQSKYRSKDKADEIKGIAANTSYQIRQRQVRSIVDLIFEDDVYSHSERLAVRYLFESVEIQFRGTTRIELFTQIRERGERPKLVNIRSKALRALYQKASNDGDAALLQLLSSTLDSVYDDVRVLALVRLQERIHEKMTGSEDWKAWPRFTENDWNALIEEQGGGLISETDLNNLTSESTIDPRLPLIGLPKPLLSEVQLLNRVLFWANSGGATEALSELIKTYVTYNLIGADLVQTRRFLLQFPIEGLFQYLLKEIEANVQDTMIKGDKSILSWHQDLWADFLSVENPAWASDFRRTIDATMRQPRTAEEKKSVEEGNSIPPFAPFVKATFESKHIALKRSALSQMTKYFGDAWVVDYLLQSMEHEDRKLRHQAIEKSGLQILQVHGRLKIAAIHLLGSKYDDMLTAGLNIVFHSSDKEVAEWVDGMVDDDIMEPILNRMNDVWSEESWVTASFLSTHFVDQKLFAKIPEPVLFGENFQEKYFEILRSVFVYETLADIQEELKAYAERKKHLNGLLIEATKVHESLQTDTTEDLDVYLAEMRAERAERLGPVETAALLATSGDLAVEIEVAQYIASLQQSLGSLIEPRPKQDPRFFDVLRLLTVARGPWVSEILQEYLATLDEKLSAEAFNVYFTRGVSAGGETSEAFLNSMIQDDHPRLDDVFGMLLSERYGSVRQLQNVFFACTRLSRIDIVFRAFEALAEADAVEMEAWENLLDSRHVYLRYRAINYLLNHDDETISKSAFKRFYKPVVQKPIPQLSSELLSDEAIEIKLANKDEGVVHAYVKNGHSLKYGQLEALRNRLPMSPGFIRQILNHDLHMLVAGLDLQSALELRQQCQELGITLVLSEGNPAFFDQISSLWQDNLTQVLRYIGDSVWVTDEVFCADLLDLRERLEDSDFASYIGNVIEAMGSVAGPANVAAMAEDLSHSNYQEQMAVSFVRSGNLQGMRHIFREGFATSGMMALGQQADSFVEQALYGSLGQGEQQHTVRQWLMQLAQVGGKADLLMTLLNTSDEYKLMASDLMSSMYDQDVFNRRIVELLELDKIRLTEMPSEVHFSSVEGWKTSIAQLRKVYASHYAVETHSETPVNLDDLERARTRLNVARTELEEKRKADANAKLKTERDAVATAKDELKEIESELRGNVVTLDEWTWFAKQLGVNNSRLRYHVAGELRTLLNGHCNRKEMLESKAHIEQVIADNQLTHASFEPLSLNGMEMTKSSAVSFGFGSLAGILRNHRNVGVAVRRKALARLVQLAVEHSIPTASAAISVAFNDPSKQVRRDAFVLALNHKDALKLSWDTIIRQASNAVSLRNAAKVNSRSSQEDPLNQLIVSELYAANQTDKLFELVQTQPHDLSWVAFDLLMDSPVDEQTVILGALKAAVASPSEVIRERVIASILSSADVVLHTNQSRLKEHRTDFLNDEPYWELLVSCLNHGVVEIAEEAANALILRSKCRESVLEYVYDTWLDAYEGYLQRKACTALKSLRSDQATTRLLDRVFEKDQTETADVQSLLDLVIDLNQCTPANATRLLKYTDVTHFGKREQLAHQALLKYTGVLKETTNASECRVDLLCDVLDGLKRNSHFSMIQSVLQSLLAHKPSKWVSARLDDALRNLSTTLTREHLLPVRLTALQVIVARYSAMTPSLKDLATDVHQNTPVLSSEWDGSDWAALKQSLDENLQYHPIESRRKEYLSDFQQESAFALIMNQGYDSEAFKTVKKILEDDQYDLSKRAHALECLAVTESQELMGSLFRLTGIGSNENIPESRLLQTVEDELYTRALSLLGRYHYTHKRDDIVRFLLDRLINTNSRRAPMILTSLWYFKGYSEHHEGLTDALLSLNTTERWADVTVDIPNNRADLKALHLWVDLMMELYEIQFAKTIPPLRTEQAKAMRDGLTSLMLTTDVNRLYGFYLTHVAQQDLSKDLELWNSPAHIFLSADNRQRLKSRIHEEGNTSQWMSLMIDGIERSAKQQKAEKDMQRVFDAVSTARELRQQSFPGQSSEFRMSDIESLRDLFNGYVRTPQTEVLFAHMIELRSELSEDVLEWLTDEYHQNRMGEWFVFNPSTFESILPLKWSSEVDELETLVSQNVSGMDFYVPLLREHLTGNQDILHSVLDMLKKRELSDSDRLTLLTIISESRREWGALQSERRKGIRNQDQIATTEEYWLSTLQLIDVVGLTAVAVVELKEILMTELTPEDLKGAALKIFLTQDVPESEVLVHVFNEYPVFRAQVSSYLTLDMLYNVLIASAAELSSYKSNLDQFNARLQNVLKQGDNVSEMHWITGHWLVIDEGHRAVIDSFQSMLTQNQYAELSTFLKVRSNRDAILSLVRNQIVADTFNAKESLTSMFWVTVEGGRVAHAVVQQSFPNAVLPSTQLIQYLDDINCVFVDECPDILNSAARQLLNLEEALIPDDEYPDLFSTRNAALWTTVKQVLNAMYPNIDTIVGMGREAYAAANLSDCEYDAAGLLEMLIWDYDVPQSVFLDLFSYDPVQSIPSFLYAALAGAEDPVVREHYASAVPAYAKYRAWNTQVKQARTNRFMKELS